jgi:hypothetical protein
MGYPYSTSTLYCRFIVNQGPNFGSHHAWKSDIISTWVQNLLDLCFLLYLIIMLWLKVWPCQYFSPATIFLKTGNLLNILIFWPSYIVCRDTCVPLVTICNISMITIEIPCHPLLPVIWSMNQLNTGEGGWNLPLNWKILITFRMNEKHLQTKKCKDPLKKESKMH